MPYKLSDDKKAVMQKEGGRWVEKKRYSSSEKAKAYLRALSINVSSIHVSMKENKK